MAKYLDLAGLNYYNSKIQAQLAGVVGGMIYQGTFDASTGKDGVGTALPTPAVGNKGQYWVCAVAGTFSDVVYEPKDWIVSNGADGWAKVDNTDPIYLGSTSISLVGNKFQRAALTGDVTASANSNATTIGAGKVTEAKIADQSVTTAKIDNGAVETTNIRNGAITEDKIKDGAVTGTKLGVEAIYDTNISQHAYIDLSKLQTIPGETILGNYGGTHGMPAALEASQVRGILNVADGANNYTLPKAEYTSLGGVRVAPEIHTGFTPQPVTTVSDRSYKIQRDELGNLAVNVPWKDNSYITESEIDTLFT